MKTIILNKYIQLLIGLVIFFTLLFTKGQDPTSGLMWKSIALAVLMVFLWLLEVIPIYVTALFPLLFANTLGIITSKDLASSYGDSNIYLFLGGFILAIALEKHKVHLQIAKRIINLVGSTKSKLLFGFTFSTGLISLWISNTATALMMLPMGFAIVAALPKEDRGKFSMLLILSIAYAASIGGAGTIIASPPNLIMASIINADPYNAGIDFITWAKFGIPISLTFMLLMYLTFNFLLGKERKDEINMDELKLSRWTKTQLRVLMIFGVVVFLWLTKDLFKLYLNIEYDDLFPAMLGAIAMFIVPQHNNENKPILNWKATKNIPWGVLILFGGGIAMAKSLHQHGAIDMIAASFEKFQHLNLFFIILILVTISVFATELISNTALANILVPVVASFAVTSEMSVYQLSIAVTLGASWAFMLPIGTPPNAIVFASGKVKMKDMLRYGFILNIISVILISLFAWLFL